MSNRKDVIKPFQIFVDVSMADDAASIPTNIQWLDNVSVQLNWTGNAQGDFEIQASLDYLPSGDPTNNKVANAGNWVAIPLDQFVLAAGSADVALIDLNEIPFPWIRVVYTRTTGTGTLNGYIVAKAI